MTTSSWRMRSSRKSSSDREHHGSFAIRQEQRRRSNSSSRVHTTLPRSEKVSKPYALFLGGPHRRSMPSPRSRCTVASTRVIIRPAEGGLVLHTRLYYADELHKANRADAPKTKFSTKELELAKSLVGHMLAPFKPGGGTPRYLSGECRTADRAKEEGAGRLRWSKQAPQGPRN